MKKTVVFLALMVMAIVMLFSLAQAQRSTKTMTFNSEDGEITMLPGINAIVRDKDGSLTIEMVPPKSNLPKEYKDVDLKVGDVIFMCNGKSVKSIDDLNEIIEKLEIGAEISFGVKRDKDRLIATMDKADPSAGGKMMVMTQTIDDGGEVKEDMAISTGAGMLKDVTFLNCGLIIKDKEGSPSVVALMPMFKPLDDGKKPDTDDILISINGTKAETSTKFLEIFDKIKVGDKVTFVFKRGDKTFSTTVTKEEQPEGDIIIKKG